MHPTLGILLFLMIFIVPFYKVNSKDATISDTYTAVSIMEWVTPTSLPKADYNVADYNITIEQIVGKRELTRYFFPDTDLVEDKVINVSDSVKLKNYILRKIESLNDNEEN